MPNETDSLERFADFEEFWPFYVGEHLKASTRQIHFAGTVAGLTLAATGHIVGGLVAAYGAAWISHFFVEKNRPATFKYPWYSVQGDFRMLQMMLKGEMEGEIARLVRSGALSLARNDAA